MIPDALIQKSQPLPTPLINVLNPRSAENSLIMGWKKKLIPKTLKIKIINRLHVISHFIDINVMSHV